MLFLIPLSTIHHRFRRNEERKSVSCMSSNGADFSNTSPVYWMNECMNAWMNDLINAMGMRVQNSNKDVSSSASVVGLGWTLLSRLWISCHMFNRTTA